MKKIIFLLLVTVSTYAQVSTGRETKFTNGIRNTASQTVTEPINLVTEGADGTYGKVLPANLPTTTATTNSLDLKTTVSAGAFSGFAVTDNGNGTINVASGIAYLRATNDQYAPIIKYPLAAYNNIPLVDGITNYVTVSYNGGSPSLVLNTTGIGIDTQTNSIAIVVARVGTTVHYISLVGSNSDPNAKIRTRYLFTESIKRETGLVISTPASLKIATTAGITYSGLIRLDVPMFNTNTTDTFTQAYQNGGGTWVRTVGLTSINNTQYSNGGTLTTLGTNKYRADFVYTLVNSPSKLYVLLGTVEYNSLSLAQAAPRPAIVPVELQQLGVLVGRVIVKKDDTVLNVASPFAVEFAASVIPDHNDLAGLNTGDFQHLTVAEKASLETTANKSGTLTASSTLYPNNNAVIAGLANYALDSNVVHKTGTESIAGAKTFTSNTIMSSIGTQVPLTINASSAALNTVVLNHSGNFNAIQVNNNSGIEAGVIGFGNNSVASALQNSFYFLNNTSNIPTGSIRFTRFNGSSVVNDLAISSNGNFLFGTLTENGSKYRFVGGNTEVASLSITTTPTTSTGTPDIVTRNPTTGVVESVPYSTFTSAENAVLLTGNQTKTGILTFNHSNGNDNYINGQSTGTNPVSAPFRTNVTSSGSGSFSYITGIGAGFFSQIQGSGVGFRSQGIAGTSAIGYIAENETGANGDLFQFKLGSTIVGKFNNIGELTVPKISVAALNTAPASATSTGTTGEIRVTATHIYVCTATNTWVRSALTTW